VKNNKKKSIQVRLPEDVVAWIDSSADKKSLKRGPTTRMYFIEALSSVHKAELKQIEFSFNHKVTIGTILVGFEVPEEINNKLLDLRKYVPVSKKKLAEILICQIVDKMREV
jgi:hypothetical protein